MCQVTYALNMQLLTQPMDPEKKSLNFIFPTKYVIPKSLKFSHWLNKIDILFNINPSLVDWQLWLVAIRLF